MWPHMQHMWSNVLFTAVGTVSQKQRQLQPLLCEAYRWAASALLTSQEHQEMVTVLGWLEL